MKWEEIKKEWKKESKFYIECNNIYSKSWKQHQCIVQTEEIQDENDEFSDFSRSKKIQLGQRANEIYRQQTQHVMKECDKIQDIVENKCNIIENLLYRYDCGILPKDETLWSIFFFKIKNGNIQFTFNDASNEYLSNQVLITKQANQLAKISLLENFDLKQKIQQIEMQQE